MATRKFQLERPPVKVVPRLTCAAQAPGWRVDRQWVFMAPGSVAVHEAVSTSGVAASLITWSGLGGGLSSAAEDARANLGKAAATTDFADGTD
ncbi:MAG: hypothetical protein WC378_00485 [Opitutaceae bacterium]|jgi:hypothetical protein